MKRINVIAVAAILLFGTAGLAGAAGPAGISVMMDFDFSRPEHDTIEELKALGWTFGGEVTTAGQAEESIVTRPGGRKALKLDPGLGSDVLPYGTKKPQAGFVWSGPVAAGMMDILWSHAISYSGSRIIFQNSAGTELFRIGLQDDAEVRFVGSTEVRIPIVSNVNIPLAVKVTWDAVAGNFSYSFTDSLPGNVFGTLNFAAAGTPDRILYILDTDNNHSREVYLFEIKAVETAGLVAETDGSTEVREELQTTDIFTAALKAAPVAGKVVKVALSSSDPNETDFSVNPKSLTFTNGNWAMPQTVTVKAADDLLIEGLETHMVSFTITADPNSDPNFAGQYFSPPVAVKIIDNDRGRLVFTESDGSTVISEQGETTDSYTIALSVQPVQDVTVDLTANTNQMTLSTSQVIFNNGNWNVPVAVTVKAIDDAAGEADPHTVNVTHTITSTDIAYVGVDPATVAVAIHDNDCTATRSLPSDITGDCVTNIEDLAAMVAGWLRCTLPNVPGCF